jgi:hypothetical protein
MNHSIPDQKGKYATLPSIAGPLILSVRSIRAPNSIVTLILLPISKKNNYFPFFYFNKDEMLVAWIRSPPLFFERINVRETCKLLFMLLNALSLVNQKEEQTR